MVASLWVPGLRAGTQVGFTRLAHLKVPISGKPEIGAGARPGHESQLPRAERSGEPARLAEGAPQGRALLDDAFGPAIGRGQRHHRRAAPRHRGEIVVQAQLGVGPVALVGFVADGEVEARKAPLDGVADELVEMRAARPEAGELAVAIA